MKLNSAASLVLILLIWVLLSSCSSSESDETAAVEALQSATAPSSSTPNASEQASNSPQLAFFKQIHSMCGARFEGQSSFPDDPDDAFYGLPLVAVIESCEENVIRIPFKVGDDTSRTWILSRTPAGLELKHDHRHDDGTPDEITMYGGTADTPGTATSQSFPADAYTANLIPEATTNEWFLTLSDDARTLIYYLERHGKPRFKATLERVE